MNTLLSIFMVIRQALTSIERESCIAKTKNWRKSKTNTTRTQKRSVYFFFFFSFFSFIYYKTNVLTINFFVKMRRNSQPSPPPRRPQKRPLYFFHKITCHFFFLSLSLSLSLRNRNYLPLFFRFFIISHGLSQYKNQHRRNIYTSIYLQIFSLQVNSRSYCCRRYL